MVVTYKMHVLLSLAGINSYVGLSYMFPTRKIIIVQKIKNDTNVIIVTYKMHARY